MNDEPKSQRDAPPGRLSQGWQVRMETLACDVRPRMATTKMLLQSPIRAGDACRSGRRAGVARLVGTDEREVLPHVSAAHSHPLICQLQSSPTATEQTDVRITQSPRQSTAHTFPAFVQPWCGGIHASFSIHPAIAIATTTTIRTSCLVVVVARRVRPTNPRVAALAR